MWYMGGKHRQSRGIVETLINRHGTGFNYCEPFCGSMSSLVRVIREANPKKVIASDINRPLMKLWRGLIEDEIKIPNPITDEQYQKYNRTRDPEDPLTAWYGIAVSFGGKWFGGLARHSRQKQQSYDFSSQINSTMKKVEVMKSQNSLLLLNEDYWSVIKSLRNYVIYLDPPYANRTKAHNFETFDTDLFWRRVKTLSETNSVYTSCFDSPSGFKSVFEWGDTVVGHHASLNRNITNEKLVIWPKPSKSHRP